MCSVRLVATVELFHRVVPEFISTSRSGFDSKRWWILERPDWNELVNYFFDKCSFTEEVLKRYYSINFRFCGSMKEISLELSKSLSLPFLQIHHRMWNVTNASAMK